MKKFAITGLCLALMVGSASAQSAIRKTAQTSPSSAAKSPSHSQNASARPITDEEAFFYYATIFGAGGDIANRYASYFDTANYKQAMANEFSRARYQEKMQARVESELKRLDFNREFVITGQGVLGEYSFASHSFPVSGGGVVLFCMDIAPTFIRNCQDNVIHVEVSVLQGAVNSADFDWLLTMPEAEASAFIKSRMTGANGSVNRAVFTKITYSILSIRGRTKGVGGLFTTYIHSVEVYSDASLTRKLGTLTKRTGIPESAYAPDVAQTARSTAKVIGKYRYRAFCRGAYGCVTPVEGTITVTDADIVLSGEQPDGSTKPKQYSYSDAFAADSTELWRADWADADYYVVWRPFWEQYFNSSLIFDNRLERDHFFVDLTQAIQQWKVKYPQFAANELKIYQGCDRNGGGFVTCPDAAPINPNPDSTPSSDTNTQTSSLPDSPGASATNLPNGPSVVMDTSMGQITCQFYQRQAPNAVANFIALAEGTKDWTDPATRTVQHHKPYFDGTTFHRVIPQFMIQGGDPTGTGTGNPGFKFADEFDPNLNFDRPGKLAMANSGPNTNGSQFFITEAAAPFLNQHYTLFGQCDDASVEVVKAIARVPRNSSDKPDTPVVLKKVTIIHNGQPKH